MPEASSGPTGSSPKVARASDQAIEPHRHQYTERATVKTKIIATVGPACEAADRLRELALAGVDVFRLNFAHGTHDWSLKIVESIRWASEDLGRPIAILGDLCGPKIRLGELPQEGLHCREGDRLSFVRTAQPNDPSALTCTYERLIDDLRAGDRVLLADGTVSLRVVEVDVAQGRAVCDVERPGTIRSRQGVHLPGVVLSTPALTDKDLADLKWAVEHRLDYVGLSFVCSAEDIRRARACLAEFNAADGPKLIAKIEKMEAVTELEAILDEADAVMVARGDLGVEVDVARVPALQKRIIRLCNQHRLPVITATQMLDSMQTNEFPTRAEASDVANAVLDGSDAVMLSGETAVGQHPVAAVSVMSRITLEAERLVRSQKLGDIHSLPRSRAHLVTEAVTLAAGTAAEHLDADLIVVATHSGRTAMAVSKQRSSVPILALTDSPETARRACLFWGVTPVCTDVVNASPQELLKFVVDWGAGNNVLRSASRIVLVGSTDWSAEGHDLMLVHAIP